MPKIGYFVFCQDCQIMPNGSHQVTQLTDPLADLHLPYIPTTFTLSFALSILNVSTSNTHTLDIELINPSKNKIFGTKNLSLPMPSTPKETDSTGNIQIAGTLKNVVFNIPGIYTAKVSLDGQEIGMSELPVYHKKTNIKK